MIFEASGVTTRRLRRDVPRYPTARIHALVTDDARTVCVLMDCLPNIALRVPGCRYSQ